MRKPVEAASLSGLLLSMIQQNMNDCRLLLVHDGSDLYSVVVQDLLLLLHNPRQVSVIHLSSFRFHEVLDEINSISSATSGYHDLLIASCLERH